MNGKRNGKRTALILLCTALTLVLTVLLGATVYARYLLNRINYVDPATMPTLSQEELDRFQEDETVPVDQGTEPDIQWDEHDTQIGKAGHVINILLIGQDRREGESRARSDAMILCTFNTQTNSLTMTSFLRDLWVQIPGYQDNKINASYAAGGMKLLNQTLEQNFGIHIDGNVEVDFSQFARIVDLLGGVELELRSDEARYINRKLGYGNLTSGLQQLTGEQALWYARIRALDADADFSRTNRQRKLIDAMIQKYKNSSLTTVLSLLEEILPMVTTDMSQSQILGYVKELFPLLAKANIVSQRIPADGAYTTPYIRNMSVVLADMDAARKLLEETLGE